MREREDFERSLKLFVVLSKAYRTIQNISDASISNYGLNPTEFAVLELLFHKGRQPLQQIGERILIASGSITYVVDKLEKKELVVRVPCLDDRRVYFAELTEKGNALVEQIFPKHSEKIVDSLSMITSEEREVLIKLLRKIGKIEL